MASINDIGVPGQPLNTPPLTEWQKAVRTVLGSDTPIDQRSQLGALAPAPGWKDFGSSYGGLQVTRAQRLVTIDAMLSVITNLAVTANGTYTMATLPAWAWPTRAVILPCIWAWTSGLAPQFARVTVDAAGQVILNTPSAQTITASTGFVAVTAAYRSIP